MSFPTTIYGANGEEHQIYSTHRHNLGTRMIMADGRVFRFAKMGAVAGVVGKVYQAAVPVANHLNCAVDTARAVGATTVSATLGATAATKDEYKEGFVHINDADAEGHIYPIKEHAAVSASAVLTATLEASYELVVALTTSSEVTFTKNAYDSVVIAPTTLTAPVMGVTPRAVTASYYCWLQTWGPAAVLTNGTLIVGKMVSLGATTSGSVDTYPITLVEGAPNTYVPGDSPVLGVVMRVNATTEYSLIFLTIAP